jgi:hypothetical protein
VAFRQRRAIPILPTPPTTRCTGIRKAASFTAITTATAICRCTSSEKSRYLAERNTGPRFSMLASGGVGQTGVKVRWARGSVALAADDNVSLPWVEKASNRTTRRNFSAPPEITRPGRHFAPSAAQSHRCKSKTSRDRRRAPRGRDRQALTRNVETWEKPGKSPPCRNSSGCARGRKRSLAGNEHVLSGPVNSWQDCSGRSASCAMKLNGTVDATVIGIVGLNASARLVNRVLAAPG